MSVSESNLTVMVLAMFSALNLAEDAGLSGWAAEGGASLVYGADLVPLHRLAGSYSVRSLALAERGSEPMFSGYARAIAGMHEYLVRGNWSQAAEHFRRAIDELTIAGDVRILGAAYDQLIRLLIDRGELADALALARTITKEAVETGDRVVEAWGRMDAGEALYAAGEVPGSRGEPAERHRHSR